MPIYNIENKSQTSHAPWTKIPQKYKKVTVNLQRNQFVTIYHYKRMMKINFIIHKS